MKIKLDRSGGLTGIPINREFDTEEFPPVIINLVKKIMENKKSNSLELQTKPKGAADHYTYKISIEDGDRRKTIVCNQYNLGNDLKSLIKQVEEYSKRNQN